MDILPYVAALVPSIGVGLVFWFVMRSIIQADRNERLAEAQFDLQHKQAPQHDRTMKNLPDNGQ